MYLRTISDILQISVFRQKSSHIAIMPPPESMPLCQLPQHKDGKVTKSKPKTAHKVERPEEAPLLPLELSLPFTHFPAEIQQMIWGEVIKGPSCHHFRIHKGVDADCDRWIIHILEKATQYDTSAYRQWKTLFQVRDRAFLAAFSHYTSRSQIQPIAVRMPANKRHVYTASAAIDIPKDLVILDFERGIQHPGFTWFEHMSPYPRSPMDFTCIQKRLVHFRKVAIHYKHHFKNACKNGPFSCYCPSIGTGIFNCSHYKACPRELACFLDCFTNLEAFYFVVEPRTKAHHRFTADFKSKAAAYWSFFSIQLTCSRR